MHESEFKIEWLYSNLRWFYLMAVAATVGIEAAFSSSPFPQGILILLVIGGIANLMVMLLLVLNTFRKPMATFTMILDVLLTLGLIMLSGGADSRLLFVSFVPIITSALRYSWIISLGVALSVVAIYWWGAWHQLGFSTETTWATILLRGSSHIVSGLVLLLAGGAVSKIGSKIKEILVEERQEKEQEAKTVIQAAHQKVRLIFELASTLSATLNYERVLESALDVSCAGLREFLSREVPQVQAIFLFGIDQTLYIVTSRGLTLTDRRLRTPGREGVLAEALQSAEPTTINEPGTDPELGQLVAMHNCREALVVPLRAGFESYGAMVMASPEPDVYSADFQDLLEAVCNQAVMALQNARLYQNLMEEKERLVAVEEDARKKLARDLHDGPTQTIAAIAMRLNYIRLLTPKEPEKAMEELIQLEDLARKTTKEIRQMLFTLRPLILETQGVVAALEQYKDKLQETDPTPIHLEAEPNVDACLGKEAQGAIFYIVEEALTNARKHAKAKDLWIRIYKRGMNVVAEVEDNGKGFDVAAVEKSYDERSSLGMLNLQERATLVGGKTIIQSTPGKGTKITLTLPIREKAGYGGH